MENGKARTTRDPAGLESMISRIVILLVAVLLVDCASQTPIIESECADWFSKQAVVTYTPSGWPRALVADLYRSKGAGPWPAVLLIYGGNWNEDDHRW